MRRSWWMLLAVILAIAVVVIAKETFKQGERAAPTESESVVQNPTAQVAPSGPALEQDESSGTSSAAPSVEAGPRSVGDASSRAEEAAGQLTSGEPTQSKPASDKKPEGPLPGSRLAECLKSGRPTMADFGKGWCVPCKMMVPVLKQAAQDYWGKANIVFVELDEHPDLGRQHRIATMPTQVFFDAQGKEVRRRMGYIDNEGIDRQFAEMGVTK